MFYDDWYPKFKALKLIWNKHQVPKPISLQRPSNQVIDRAFFVSIYLMSDIEPGRVIELWQPHASNGFSVLPVIPVGCLAVHDSGETKGHVQD